MTIPARANVVIIGGGVIGTSIAFHLAEAGVRDVVLVERDLLGSGSTCKAAGGFRAQFSDVLNIQLGARSIEAFSRFGSRPGHQIDLRRVGYLFLLSRPADVRAFERNVALQNELGVPSRMVGSAEARKLSPLIDTHGILAATFSPDDGHCTPESVVMGYAGGARRLGAQIITRCTVLGIEMNGCEIAAVTTTRGRIATPAVICAAGAWSAAVGDMAGVRLDVTPYRRQIALTEPFGMPGLVPVTIDFSTSLYFHGEGRGLLVGMSDPDQAPGFGTRYSERWLPHLGDAISIRAPSLLDVGLTGGWAGLYEVTPDHNALIGEDPDTSRFIYATGFSGHGFMLGPPVGEVVRDLFLARPPFVDISPLNARRFENRALRAEANFV